MTTKRVLLRLILLAIIVTGIFVYVQQSHASPAETLKAEQEIYSILLLDQRNAYNDVTDQIQLLEYTNSGELQRNTSEYSAGYQAGFGTDDFPNLQRKTWIDYQEQNKVSYPIKDYLPPSANVIFVNPTNGKQLYWWVSFSRIGFNSSLTQALVLVGDCRGEACYDSKSNSIYSMGDYVFLQKTNGKWRIQSRQDAWFIEALLPPQ